MEVIPFVDDKSDQAHSTKRNCRVEPIGGQRERERYLHVSTEKPMLHAKLASKELKGKDDVRVTYSSCSHTASPAQRHALSSIHPDSAQLAACIRMRDDFSAALSADHVQHAPSGTFTSRNH